MPRLTARSVAFSALVILLTVILTVGDFGWVDLLSGFIDVCKTGGTCGPEPTSDWVLSAGYGAIAGVIIPAGLLAQVRAPARQVSGLLQVALAASAFLAAGVLGTDRATVVFSCILTAIVALIWAIHPNRHVILSWRPHLSLHLLALACSAALPLCLYASQLAANNRAELPGAAEAVRVGMSGWIGNGAMALGILLVALLAACRPPGWRVSAWSAGTAALLFGLSALRFPTVPGSVGAGWGMAGMAWGVLFIGVATWVHTRDSDADISMPESGNQALKQMA